MKIYILLSETNKPKVEANFKQQKCVGIEFEFFTDFDQVMELIDARGFFMDKLVIISSMFKEWTEIQRQQLTRKLLSICEHLDPNKEIFMLDSNQYFRNDFTTTLSFYPQFIYQPQKVEVKNLFGLITGDIVTPETPNINERVKRQGFFEKLFNRGGMAQAFVDAPEQDIPEEMQEDKTIDENQINCDKNISEDADTPLFSADEFIQEDEDASATSEFVDDIEDIFRSGKDTERPILNDNNFSSNAFDDTPLFAEPKPESDPGHESQQYFSEPEVIPEPEPEPEVIPEPEPEQIIHKPKKNTEVKKQKAEPKVSTHFKSGKSEYVNLFQKRTKIMLFTGERRSGISTAVSNCAAQASADGLKVLIIDLDYERRGQAYNFPFIHDENDIKMTHSLYNANKNPSQLEEYAIHLEDGLDLLGTSLAVTETNIMHQHVTDSTLQRLVTSSTSLYDLIFIDCPYEQLREYPCLILLSHIIIHSMNTDHRSIINTLNAITTDDFDSINSYNTYMARVMLLLNNYMPHFWNGKELNERMVPVYISELIGDSTFQNIAVVGRIPSYDDYDAYMEDGKLLINNKRYVKDFVNLLNEIAIRG